MHSIRGHIHVTPRVHVCLVLLILFLLVTPLANGEVDVPRAARPEAWPVPPVRSRITVEYGDPPRIFLDDDPSPLSQPALEALLRAIYLRHPRREILLRADRRLRYSDVKRVIQAVREAGFEAVGLVAERSR